MASISIPTSEFRPELDLSRAEDAIAYLADTPFASTHAEALSGGTANFIFRLHLVNPLANASGAQTVILKHAKSWVATNKEFALDVRRQDIEVAALKHVRAFLPADSLATVPAVYYHDTIAHVLIMEDAGPNSRNLKDLLRESPLSKSASRELGTALGRFLAALHVRGSAESELPDAVRKNDDGRRITSWITYGQLLDTLKHSTQNTGLIEPPLAGVEAPSEAEIEEISALADATIKKIYEAQKPFTMGDFWTGNVIVRSTDNGVIERVFVVDWELAKPGTAFIDFAQFVAEMHTLKRFHPEATVSIDSTLRTYAEAYNKGVRIDEKFIKGAASHVGAHMIAVTPNILNWGSKKTTRKVFIEGIEYVLGGIRGDEEWLKASAVGGLLHNTRM
ncbi:hypothetical protein A7U60_g5873 [Sanghuangporus baumii]|uniref:Aminoglycoside phosphotransferase domain-containing protein n=1 Tax=Sanghuangporus baumii TaxID=108892 RepID=A0A9Q5N7P3_SANBA|nr:hypothetical protein A7U60_g5873 [Sanghuangporus baumii]